MTIQNVREEFKIRNDYECPTYSTIKKIRSCRNGKVGDITWGKQCYNCKKFGTIQIFSTMNFYYHYFK